eukprot:TRINITY_DN8546_c0_g1_i1.p1 TRINITY_DN8546_c0_g1~~TRINITY_DN8546_c0_g1_i1.p1  ORF type:complete len:486 (-),score=52.93 TRINITY_DN8546_c0_g1_i1:81-1538(-)
MASETTEDLQSEASHSGSRRTTGIFLTNENGSMNRSEISYPAGKGSMKQNLNSHDLHEQLSISKNLPREMKSYGLLLLAFQVAMIVLYASKIKYITPEEAVDDWPLFQEMKDVSIMVFFGFGYLMTFVRYYGFSAAGYTFVVSAMAVQWSIPLQLMFEHAAHPEIKWEVGVFHVLNGLFCAATLMISYGAILGRVTPLQMIIMGIIEPVFYWLNIFIGSLTLKALDIGGGMFIHVFGCYFGMSMTFFLSHNKSYKHPNNRSNYVSDLFSLAGTLFLFMMWPSFNAAIAGTDLGKVRAAINTFMSLTGSILSVFIVTRIINKRKFDIIHVQNSTLAGGVMMGVAADLDLTLGGALVCGAFAGTVSTFGFTYLTPFLNRLKFQDTCGINNLHGIPGLMGSFVAVFVTLGRRSVDDYPRGFSQPAIQVAAIAISVGLGLLGGSIAGMIMKASESIYKFRTNEFYQDVPFWSMHSDEEPSKNIRMSEFS